MKTVVVIFVILIILSNAQAMNGLGHVIVNFISLMTSEKMIKLALVIGLIYLFTKKSDGGAKKDDAKKEEPKK